MSLFKKDLEKEGLLAAFLSEQYLLRGWKTERTTRRDQQMRGIDLLIEDKKGRTFKVDEKAQLHYIGHDLPTFALEISYEKDEQPRPGWLFDPQKETEVYAFIFSIHLKTGAASLDRPGDIARCDAVFVNRQKLLAALAELGLDQPVCEAHVARLLAGGEGSKIKHAASGLNFQVSAQLAERPVNLVVRRAFLEKIGRSFRFESPA